MEWLKNLVVFFCYFFTVRRDNDTIDQSQIIFCKRTIVFLSLPFCFRLLHFFVECGNFDSNVRKPDTKLFIRQAIYLFQGRMSGCVLFLLACIHPVTSCRAGGIFHPSISLGSFGSSKQATPCMEARIMHAHLFYLGIDYFVYTNCLHIPPIHRHTIG